MLYHPHPCNFHLIDTLLGNTKFIISENVKQQQGSSMNVWQGEICTGDDDGIWKQCSGRLQVCEMFEWKIFAFGIAVAQYF